MADLTPNTPVVSTSSVAEVETPVQEMFASAAATASPVETTATDSPTAGTEPPASPPAAVSPASQPQPSAFATQAAELGIQLPATATDSEVFAAMQTRMKEIAPLAGYAQSLLPHADAINEFFATRGVAPQQPAAPAGEEFDVEKHFKQHWNAPQLTPAMQTAIDSRMVVRDPDTGVMVAKPGYEVMVSPLLQDMNAAINWEREAVREYFQGNPIKKTYEALRDPLERLAEAAADRKLNAYIANQEAQRIEWETQQRIQQFEQQNETSLYQQSAAGERMLTPQGVKLVQMVRHIRDTKKWSGPTDELLLFCNAALATKQKSFLDTALQQAAHQPSGGANNVQSPTGPVPVTARELEDLFLTEYQALRGTAA